MARGRKKFATKEEELEVLNAEIEEQEELLKELQNKRDELEESIQTDQAMQMFLYVRSKGKSYEDVVAAFE